MELLPFRYVTHRQGEWVTAGRLREAPAQQVGNRPEAANSAKAPTAVVSPDQCERRGALLPRSWAPIRALPRVAGLSAVRFAGFTRPLPAAMATVLYLAA